MSKILDQITTKVTGLFIPPQIPATPEPPQPTTFSGNFQVYWGQDSNILAIWQDYYCYVSSLDEENQVWVNNTLPASSVCWYGNTLVIGLWMENQPWLIQLSNPHKSPAGYRVTIGEHPMSLGNALVARRGKEVIVCDMLTKKVKVIFQGHFKRYSASERGFVAIEDWIGDMPQILIYATDGQLLRVERGSMTDWSSELTMIDTRGQAYSTPAIIFQSATTIGNVNIIDPRGRSTKGSLPVSDIRQPKWISNHHITGDLIDNKTIPIFEYPSLKKVSEVSGFHPVPSPDGKKLAYTTLTGDLAIIDL